MKKRLILATMAAFAVSGAGAQQPLRKSAGGLFLPQRQHPRGGPPDQPRPRAANSSRSSPSTPYPTEYRAGGRPGAKRRSKPGRAPRLKSPVERPVAVRRDLRRLALLVGDRGASRGDVPHFLRLRRQDRRAVHDPRGQPHGPQRGRHPQSSVPRSTGPRRASPSAAVRWAVRKMPSKSGSVPV